MPTKPRQPIHLCPACQGDSRITASTPLASGMLQRVRRCMKDCGGPWTTYEVTTHNLADLRRALRISLHHAQASERQIAAFLEDITSDRRSLKDLERIATNSGRAAVLPKTEAKYSDNGVLTPPHHAGQTPATPRTK